MKNRMSRMCLRHSEGPHHDCRRVDQVNDLIPEATKAATEQLIANGVHPDSGRAYRGQHDRAFVEQMNRIACERGLRQVVRN